MADKIAALPEMNHLQKKILYTLGFLALYRIGVAVPVPGVDAQALASFFESQQKAGGTFFGLFNMYAGGALERFSVFALGVMPYISASIVAQLLTVVVPALEQLSKEGEAGRRKITQYTRYGTIVLALIQGFTLAKTLSSGMLNSGGVSLVPDAGVTWLVLTTISLTAGTAFVMWLGEQITDRGVGNGISLIIFAGIVATFPSHIRETYQAVNSGQSMGWAQVALLCALGIAICAGVVFVEQGARLIPVQYAKRQVGRQQFSGQTTHLPVKINSAGVIPPIFASSLLQFPATIAMASPDGWFSIWVNKYFAYGQWLHNIAYLALIIFFAFFYTSITFKPDDIAENLQKNGGSILGIRPGPRTSEYLSRIISRLTLAGAVYLAIVCITPTVMTNRFGIQFAFGGTSLLIVVGVALDTFRQIEAHRQSLRYDAFLKTSRGSGKAGRIRRR